MYLSAVQPGTPFRRVDLLSGLVTDRSDEIEEARRRVALAIVPVCTRVIPEDFSGRLHRDPAAHKVVPFWCAVLCHRNVAVLRGALDVVLESHRLAMKAAGAEYPPLFAIAKMEAGEADVMGRPAGVRRVNVHGMVFMLLGLMGTSAAVVKAVEDLNREAPRGDEANAIIEPWHIQDGPESRWCQFKMRMSPDAVDRATGVVKPATLGAAWEDVNKERPDPAKVGYPMFDASASQYAVSAAADFIWRFGMGERCVGAAAAAAKVL